MIRGVCTLVAGLVQCMQHNMVRGAYNICRSWRWIRHLRPEASQTKQQHRGRRERTLRGVAENVELPRIEAFINVTGRATTQPCILPRAAKHDHGFVVAHQRARLGAGGAWMSE